uniref:Josephin-2 n=1 Tax=Biomphalaria glabrata TaxID=6526 RepID=A0A2C9K6S3_BIOGL
MMSKKSDAGDKQLYHERQVKELCALHALNNLMQKKDAFTKKDLDDICLRLSPDTFINPHRSMLGLGNYDVNVIMAALQEKGYETIWFDKRKKVNVLIPDKIMGFILNTPTDYKLGFVKLPIHRKHWIAIRWLNGKYMNLDSKLDAPCAIGDEASLLEYLGSELSNGDKELLLVVEKEVYDNSLWRRDSEGGEKKDAHTSNSSGSSPSNSSCAGSPGSNILKDKSLANGTVAITDFRAQDHVSS